MTDLADSIRAARAGFSADEYIRRVKTSVIEEMQRIDPSIKIEDTSYFNHSAIPDLVVRWTRDADARSVYLRGSYHAIIASRDTEFLRSGRPILLALDPDIQSSEPSDTPVSPQILTEEAASSQSTLITDSDAMGTIGQPSDLTETPLGPLVRANYLQGGKGFIDPVRAELLVTAGSQGEDSRIALEDVVRENFLPDAALRLQRTAQVIDVALGRSATTEDGATAMITGGQLTTVELRSILPWLMRQGGLTDDRSFWGRLGDLFDLGMLEGIAGDLVDVDLTRLVAANARKWTSRRSYLGVSQDIDEPEAAPDGAWMFKGKVLGASLSNQRVSIASKGSLLQGRHGSLGPLWDDLSQSLADYRVVAATLRGVTRSITVSAEESEDIKADIGDVASSVEDNFRVLRLTVRVADQPSDEPADIEVDFSRSTATASPNATIRDLVRITGNLVSGHGSISVDSLNKLAPDND